MHFVELCERIVELGDQHCDAEHVVMARVEKPDGRRPKAQGLGFHRLPDPVDDMTGDACYTSSAYSQAAAKLNSYRERHGDWFCATRHNNFEQWWGADCDLQRNPKCVVRVYKARKADVIEAPRQVVFHHAVAEKLFEIECEEVSYA